ncbi:MULTISPECIES: FkbM family methyltransferase [Actibacterium]|jgi:FkbM family methyltransferase|uniref:FkbM family methyltransferase n=1 Tax=Actibacterium naphthalenivorans TaxID=1614693 RepID=A0A840C8W9_9RHOB|nr:MULTISPECIES: FkbM family methyltransferase [Actibacterium]ALG89798.1 FkbM family methyltransferase [Actibacterium sp. EMB200-NS6]MBB4020492.1 FkbM family methyltransferase [Actibacterium naphthalenivorans]
MPKTEQSAAASHMGINVPESRFLDATRIARIDGGRYEAEEIQGALHLIREGDRVLELGAGLGLVGAVIARNCAPARVLSFEANPELIEPIRALYRMNGLEDVISVRNQVAVSAPDRPETLPFHVHRSFLGSSLNPTAVRVKETVDVPTAGFATICAELKPDVIVMDIEGGELELLEHAVLDRVRAMVIEFHPNAYEVSGMRRCKDLLRAAGFTPVPALSTRWVWAAERAAPGA